MTSTFNFGEVWLADLNPSQGTEPGKKRPVLILQNQILLDIKHPSTLIVPLTTNLIDNAEPLRIRLKAGEKLKKDSDFLIDQLRAIDNKRLIEGPLVKCPPEILKKVQEAVIEIIDYSFQNYKNF